MVSTTSRKKRNGDTSGTVIRKKSLGPDAPSSLAASYSSSGTPWSPASSTMMLNPSTSHIVVSDSETTAMPGSWSQLMPRRPSSESR